MELKEPKLFGKDEDGLYNGKVEQIETGNKEYKILGLTIKKRDDQLDISNRKHYGWWFSLVTGYRQIGTFPIKQPHNFNEGDLVIVEKVDNKIINVKKDAR